MKGGIGIGLKGTLFRLVTHTIEKSDSVEFPNLAVHNYFEICSFAAKPMIYLFRKRKQYLNRGI